MRARYMQMEVLGLDVEGKQIRHNGSQSIRQFHHGTCLKSRRHRLRFALGAFHLLSNHCLTSPLSEHRLRLDGINVARISAPAASVTAETPLRSESHRRGSGACSCLE